MPRKSRSSIVERRLPKPFGSTTGPSSLTPNFDLESRRGGIKQRTEYARAYLLEFAPELPLVEMDLGRHLGQLHDRGAIEKVWPRCTEVGNCV